MTNNNRVHSIDLRQTFCPGALYELIPALKHADIGEEIDILSNDSSDREDVSKWVSLVKQRCDGVVSESGYDRIRVTKVSLL